MKTIYSIERDRLQPPIANREIALFTCALQTKVLRDWLSERGTTIPEQFDLTHNTGNDDPPDLHALGLGWECTEFPPNQSALNRVHDEYGPMGMIVPGFSETGADISKIRKLSLPFTGYSEPVYAVDEIRAYEHAFLKRIVSGPKSKDVQGNDVLLLDNRGDPNPEFVIEGIRQAIRKSAPAHIHLLLLVWWDPNREPRTAILYTREARPGSPH